MGFKVNFPEEMTGWTTGEGRATRGIYHGNITLEDIETRNGHSCWELKMTPDSVYIPVEGAKDGSLERLDDGASLSIYLWYPQGDDKEAIERDMRKVLGYTEAAYGKAVPRGRGIDPVKVMAKAKEKVAIKWDPKPPGTKGVWDQHSPLDANALEKLLDDSYKVVTWPQDGRVSKAGADAGGKGKGKAKGAGRRRFNDKEKDKDTGSDDAADEFLADDEDEF